VHKATTNGAVHRRCLVGFVLLDPWFYVLCFVDRCLSFCTFSFYHCVVCSSSIYVFWLLLWYLQTPLIWTIKRRIKKKWLSNISNI